MKAGIQRRTTGFLGKPGMTVFKMVFMKHLLKKNADLLKADRHFLAIFSG